MTMQSEHVIEQLEGGMRALLIPWHANNIVAVACFMPVPRARETPDHCGLLHFTHAMLARGTTSLNAQQLAEAIESLGSSLGSDAGDDYSHAHLVCTGETFAPSMALFADVLQNPVFAAEEIEKERQNTIAAIRRADDDKFSFTMRHFVHELYGGHGYGLPTLGYPETVAHFTRDQLTDVHRVDFNPAEWLFVIVGNFVSDEARALLREHFKPLPIKPRATIPPPPPLPASRRRLQLECEQAVLTLGYRACGLLHPDYPAVRVLNGVLGEGMSSRLFQRLRDEQGLAYATGSSLAPHRDGGHIVGYIGTKPESLDQARDGMLQIFEQVRNEPVDAEELQRARNYIVGKFLIDHQTNYKRGFYLGHFEMLGMGLGMDEAFPLLIQAITAEQVLGAAQRYIVDEPTIVELVPGSPDEESE